MKDKKINDREKLLEALMSDEFEIDDASKSTKKKRDKDSLLMDSVMYNRDSNSHKDIHHEDSMHLGPFSNNVSKVNMTEDMGKFALLDYERKKQSKDKRFLNKLIDRASTSQKKLRPKSSKGIRTNHVKVNTMSHVEINTTKNKNKKVTNYLNSNEEGNRLGSKHSSRKKAHGLGNVRPSSSKNFSSHE